MSGHRRFRTPKIVPLLLLTLVCGVLAVGYVQTTRPEIERTGLSERPRPISASTVRIADTRPSVGAFGEVVAEWDVESRALVAEPVVAVGENFLDGGTVRTGELLIELDAFEHRAAVTEAGAQVPETRAEPRAAEEDLAEDRTLLALVEREQARGEALLAMGTTAEKTVDDALSRRSAPLHAAPGASQRTTWAVVSRFPNFPSRSPCMPPTSTT